MYTSFYLHKEMINIVDFRPVTNLVYMQARNITYYIINDISGISTHYKRMCLLHGYETHKQAPFL